MVAEVNKILMRPAIWSSQMDGEQECQWGSLPTCQRQQRLLSCLDGHPSCSTAAVPRKRVAGLTQKQGKPQSLQFFFQVVMFLLNNRQARGSPGSTPWQLRAGLAIASFKWCCSTQLKQRTGGNCFPIDLMVMWEQRRNCNATLML